jgi:hypothetical protein
VSQYLLLEFESDAQCQAFVEKVDAGSVAGKRFWVVGIFQKPRKWCDCESMKNATEREQAVNTTRGSRFGWVVHTQCGRARSLWQSPRNLRDADDVPPRQMNAFMHLGHKDPTKLAEPYPISVKVVRNR